MDGYEEGFVYNSDDIRLDSNILGEAMQNLSIPTSSIELIKESNSIKELLPGSLVELEKVTSTRTMPTLLTTFTAREEEQISSNLKHDSLPLQRAAESVLPTEETHDMSTMKTRATPSKEMVQSNLKTPRRQMSTSFHVATNVSIEMLSAFKGT